MSYILCDIYLPHLECWDCSDLLPTYSVIFYSNGYKFHPDEALIKDVYSKTLKVMHTQTHKISNISYQEFVQLKENGELIGVDLSNPPLESVHCISPLGYLISEVIDIVDINGYSLGHVKVYGDEAILLHRVYAPLIPTTFQIYDNVFTNSTKSPLFYQVQRWNIDLDKFESAFGSVFIGDYIAYLFTLDSKVQSFLSRVDKNLLTIRGLSLDNSGYIRQQGAVTYRVNDMGLFRSYITQAKLLRR